MRAPDRRVAQPVYSACALGAVGAGAVVSRGPVNTVARLAIGSSGSGTIAATRWLIEHTDAASL